MVTIDLPAHERSRSLLNKLLTPRRLKENEAFMWNLADRQLDEFIANGRCELLAEYAKPFATPVIADVLGVPEEDRDKIRFVLGAGRSGSLGA
jgi:cytochrome P450